MTATRTLAALGTVVSLWAHPDDETYLAGGTMAALRDIGSRVVCVTATRGEGGNGLDVHGTDEQRAELGAIRSTELDAALDCLGISEHRWLDYADGGLAGIDRDVAADRVRDILEAVAADTVLTFGPDGFTGHPDHQTVAAWAALAISRTRRPVRLLQAVHCADDRRLSQDLDERFGVYRWGRPPLVEAGDLAVRTVLSGPALDHKVRALRLQESQTAEILSAVGDEEFARWTSTECFREQEGGW